MIQTFELRQALRQTALALDTLHEAITRKTVDAAVSPLEKSLQAKIAYQFQRQGIRVVQRLKRIRGSFVESVGDEFDDVFDNAIEASSDEMQAAIEAATKAALIAGGKALARELNYTRIFSLTNPRAITYIRDNAAEQIANIDSTTKERIRTIVLAGIENGLSYSAVARQIKSEYDRFAVGVPQQHIRSRAELIAVTEIGNAYNEGNLIQAASMADVGIAVEKYWLTVGDQRVSPGCRENQSAGWIAIDKDFPSGHSRPLRFPGCRCTLQWRRAKGSIAQETAIPVRSFDDGEAATEYFKSNPTRPKLSNAEKNDVGYYQSLGYEKFNGHLRGTLEKPLSPAETDALNRFSSVVSKAALRDNVQAFRGMLLETPEARAIVDRWQPGKTFIEPGFISTTTDRETHKMFGGDIENPYGGSVSITMRVPAGTPALYMPTANPQRLTGEYELLLNKGLKYRVISKREINGNFDVEIEILQ